MLALDKPKPNICWNLVRGNSSTSCQKSVRPVKPVSPARGLAARQPGDDHAGHGDDRDRRGDHADREELAHPRVDGEQAQARHQDARHQGRQRGPGVREEEDGQGKADARQGGTPLQQAGEPEHDRQPGRDRCVLGHLRGRHRPDHAGQPAVEVEGLSRGDQQAEKHRAERHVEAAKLHAQEQHVASAPPWRQQPERGQVRVEPEGPVDLTEVRSSRDREGRVDDEQAHQAEEHVRAQPEFGIHRDHQQERQRQGALRENLADVGRQVDQAAGDVGEGVEEQQRPGDADPAPDRALPRLRRVPWYRARTGAHDGGGHQPRCHLASLTAALTGVLP